MKKKTVKKLQINKSTMTNLTANEAAKVMGGADTCGSGYAPCQCNATALCVVC